jgi:hypothetical protein
MIRRLAVPGEDMKRKRHCPPSHQEYPQTPLPSLSGYLCIQQSPIHLSLLILFIREEMPKAASDPRYRQKQRC